MATPTQLDILNAVNYLTNRDTLSFILKWRSAFPHILIDYNIRWASNADYYVPPELRYKSAVVVKLYFSQQGCESMSCFPYTETGVIDFLNSPLGGYTQTSNTAVQYNQPPCFHLDTAAAARDGHIQSVELRYTSTNGCVMVDSFTKAWMNAPYIRTSRHVVRGVDDVPGFDVSYDVDPAFPERVTGHFNEAYCRRFGRNVQNNSCTQPWYETFVSFVLGESILTTFKLAATQVFDDLRDFNYLKPSALLPDAPAPEGESMLEEWYRIRDSTINLDVERGFMNNVFDMKINEVIDYKANVGFSRQTRSDRMTINEIITSRSRLLQNKTGVSTDDLDSIIMQFLEDHTFIMSILTDLGFNVLESTVTSMLQQLNKVLIPSMKRMLLMHSRRFTVALLGETYKAAMVHALNRAFISTISTVARATTRAISAATSIVNLALMFVTVADLVMMIWDPFGYNSMFPRGYLDDLSTAFLSAYYESIDAPDRQIIEFVPQNFSYLMMDEDEDYFSDSMLHLADYLAALDVNSNGQMLNLNDGEAVDDIDESYLIGASLSSNNTWIRLKQFCLRHDNLSLINHNNYITIGVGAGALACVISLLYYMENYNKINKYKRIRLNVIILILIVLCCLLSCIGSIKYYTNMANYNIR
nr:P74 [Darna trima granulovirus]